MPESPDPNQVPRSSSAGDVAASVAAPVPPRQDPDPPDVVDLAQVLKDEHEWIYQRRKEAGFNQQSQDGEPADRVGLALSGGGIRSASFNLGILQALYRGGFLRLVDYLSTVSGGGYIGAFFSSHVRTLGDKRLYEPIPPEAAANGDQTVPVKRQRTGAREAEGGVKIGLGSQESGTPPPAVQELLDNGQYLNRPLQFFNRYLFGLALNNIAIFSALVALCVAVAWVWRSLDFVPTRWCITETNDWIAQNIGTNWVLEWLGTDKGVCFLPAFVLFVAWILMWIGSLLIFRKAGSAPRDWSNALTRILLLVTLICGLIGFAVLLGNSKISVTASETSEAVPSRIGVGVVILGVLGLLPVLRPWRLIGSGQRPRSHLETYLFHIACTSLLVGVPLFLIFWTARENVSGYGDHSVDRIFKWKEFAERIRQDKDHWPANAIWEELAAEDNGVARYDVSQMKDVADMNDRRRLAKRRGDANPKNENLNEIKTLQDFLKESDLNPVFGTLPNTKYPYIVMRRELMLRAINQVFSDRKAEFPFGYVRIQRVQAAAQMAAAGRSVPGEALLIGQVVPVAKSRSRPITGPPSPAVGLTPDQQERLQELLTKYIYLYDNKAKAVDFQREFDKQDFQRELGQLLLAQHYPELVPAAHTIVQRAVVIDADQQTRLGWLAVAVLFLMASVIVVNLNATSLHGFYRDQLAAAYVEDHVDGRSISVRQLKYNVSQGAPFHLMSATLMRYRSIWEVLKGKDKKPPADAPATVQRTAGPTELFQFSPLHCGAESTGFRTTKKLKVNGRRIQLADAMAISGAAVTPLQVKNALIRVLMMILNIRLGQWLPHPGRRSSRSPIPTMLGVLLTIFRKEANRSLCFVTDGGHHENLGAWPLLQRRCRLIVVCDASQDTAHAFDDFLRLVRRARLEQGINLVELDPAPDGSDVPFQLHPLRLHPDGPGADAAMLRSLKDRFSRKHYIMARIRYTSNAADDGLLVYAKASLTGDEDNDLVGYCKENASFPHDPTSDTMFDHDQVESYRQLGYHIGDGLCRDLIKALDDFKLGAAEFDAALAATPSARRLWALDQHLAGPIVAHWMRVTRTQPAADSSRRRDLFQRILAALTRLHSSIDAMQTKRSEADTVQAKWFEAIAEKLGDVDHVIEELKAERDRAQGDQRTVIDSITLTLKQFLELTAGSKTATTESGGLIMSAKQWEDLKEQLHECQRELEPPPRKRVDLAAVRELIQNCVQMIESADLEHIKRP